ncbi:MAG TPA: hypothetical protein VGY56_11675, partial [Verrucomicrobiae bacterium]|nr:hypothetical protein [Verrucomicrobiae bacterium]
MPEPARKSAHTMPAFYRGGFWRFGLMAARTFPPGLLKAIARAGAGAYLQFQPSRVGIVRQNFFPVLNGDHSAATKAARAAHKNFAAKLIDLWRVETGDNVTNWLTNNSELEIIHAARRRGRGALFITLHLGNWEHGGLLLKQLSIPLTILSLAEPDDGLTEMRNAARARYGVDTLIIGEDDFA